MKMVTGFMRSFGVKVRKASSIHWEVFNPVTKSWTFIEHTQAGVKRRVRNLLGI